MASNHRPGHLRMLWWGLTKRCPRCGRGQLFQRWFTMLEDCPRCRLHFEREPGYWTGAMAVNIAVTSASFGIGFVIALALTVPDVPVAPLLAIFVPAMIVLPIVFYPFSKTLWVAIDRAILHQLDPQELRDVRRRR